MFVFVDGQSLTVRERRVWAAAQEHCLKRLLSDLAAEEAEEGDNEGGVGLAMAVDMARQMLERVQAHAEAS